jgi:hypothetical protein
MQFAPVTAALQSRRKETPAVDINITSGPATLITTLVEALRRSAIRFTWRISSFYLKRYYTNVIRIPNIK